MKVTSLALAVVCLVGLSGCKTLEQEIQQDLGLKSLEFQGNSAQDPCVNGQFMALYNEYQALNKNDRVAIKALISSRLDVVIFTESQVVSQVSGATSTLLMMDHVCSGTVCTDHEAGRKQVSDLTSTTGNAPQITQLARDGRVLKLSPQMKLDGSLHHLYVTNLLTTYDHTDTDQDLLAGLRSGEITYLRDESQAQQICGANVTLKSLAESLE